MIIYVDIDETICYYNGERDYNIAIPHTERIEKINNLFNDGHTIIYWTARGTLTNKNWFQITLGQLTSWGCKFHELRMGKPAYDLFIDDKNINSETYFQS
jgi:hydroxymethylpyrimidine pyrophosphatase-like HAD family hydrolase